MERKGMRVRFNKTYKGETYLFYLRVQINSYEGILNRVAFNEEIPCIISKDFKEISIPGGIELTAYEDWNDKKTFYKLKVPKEIKSKLKEYILCL